MRVSVIIPTYRRNDLLFERAIPSILAQTLPTYEVIVVHDGNWSDGIEESNEVLDLCDRNAALNDPRVSIHDIPRQDYPEGSRWGYWGLLGLKALNYGLDRATGDWIAVLNDDDEFDPRHHEVLYQASAPGIDFVYGKSVTPWGQEYGSWPPGDGALTQGSYLYRGKARDYRYDLRCLEDRALNGDADMWTRMFNGGVEFRSIPNFVHRYYPSATRAGS